MRILLPLLVLFSLSAPLAHAQEAFAARYDIGQPALTTLYVSPDGDDAADGLTPDAPLRTLTAAWERIPTRVELEDTGYRILLAPGVYGADATPHWWESRWGTYEHPIIIEAAAGMDTVYLAPVDMFDLRFVYFIGLNIEAGVDAFHCASCQHILVRGGRFTGADPETYAAQETVKFNQSQHIYLEDNDISGAWDNALDFVAVQYGHVIGNRIHNAGDWCVYAKGGSASILYVGNEIFDCGTGGFSAGQGAGFQFMVPPWIQYEAYDIRFVNNIVHHTEGAGAGVQGGYNVLVAHNTFYHVGLRSHLLEVVYGSRTCDGEPGNPERARCDAHAALGGWGPSSTSAVAARIPNRNVYLLNNLIYNPPGIQSAYQHFAIFGAYESADQTQAHVPVPTRADEGLVIRGNVIWNGDESMPLGIEASGDPMIGCASGHPTCHEAQVRADNAIGQIEPVLVNPQAGDFRLAAPLPFASVPIPDFVWELEVPSGGLENRVPVDFAGVPRGTPATPGAYEGSASGGR